MRLAIADIEGGAEALSEIDFARMCRRYKLGTLMQQEVRRDRFGNRRYIDGKIKGPTGKIVRFEVDGGIHLIPETYWDDMHRQNELVIGETPVLRFSPYAVRYEEEVVADQFRRALA